LQNNSFLEQLNKIANQNLHKEHFGVSELAKEMGVNRTILYRKIKSYTGKSASKYLNEIRLQKAYTLLHDQAKGVSEVSYEVGFGSPSYFIKCFHEYYGYSPGDFQKENHVTTSDQSHKKTTGKSKLIPVSLTILALIVVSISVYFIFFNNKSEIEKTIAILPPKDISPSGTECFILEGFREEIQSKLHTVGNLIVTSGTSADTYRHSEKKLKEIARELNVNYVVETRGQTINKVITIWVQLINTNTDKHIWSESYEIENNERNLYEIQSEITISIAKKVHAIVSDEEIQTLEELPTKNPAAYALYQIGSNLLANYELNGDRDGCWSAKTNFEKALQLDSTFGGVYSQLADIYVNHHRIFEDVDPIKYNLLLDSGLVMIEKALELGTNHEYKTMRVQADYYHRKGMHNLAINAFKKLWKNKPKDFNYYREKAAYYVNSNDFYNSIKNNIKYLKLEPDWVLANRNSLQQLIHDLNSIGFWELADKYNNELYEISNDSILYYTLRKIGLHRRGEADEAIRINKILFTLDTTNINLIAGLWFYPYCAGKLEEAYKYARYFEQKAEEHFDEPFKDALIGSLYLWAGMEKEANEHILGNLKYLHTDIDENIPFAQRKTAIGLLAGIYSLLGEKEKALENFEIWSTTPHFSYSVLLQVKNLLLYDNIRLEPEFIEGYKRMQNTYQKEHEKVKKMLVEEGVLSN